MGRPGRTGQAVQYGHAFCSLAAACFAASRFPPAKTTFPAFCWGAAAAPLDVVRPGAALLPVCLELVPMSAEIILGYCL